MKQSDLNKFFDKNDLILQKLIIASLDPKHYLRDGSFFKEVSDIQIDFGISMLVENAPLTEIDFKNKSELQDVDTQVSNFIDSLDKKSRLAFLERIEKLRIRSNLGEEWFDTLNKIVITHTTSAPAISIVTDVNKRRNSIHFIVGPNTSKKELDMAWIMSERLRKKMFGTSRVAFATEKAVEDFMETSELIEIANSEQGSGNRKLTQIEIIGMITPVEGEDEMPSAKEDRRVLNRLKTRKKRLNK